MKIEVSVIIPTYHRPNDLNNCLDSILSQTRLPDEIILIDDGDLAGFPKQELFLDKGIECIYTRKSPPGVTESRNKGADLARGNILIFLEDDVVLFKDYIAQLLLIYETQDDDGELGGVGGIIDNESLTLVDILIERIPFVLFGISGFREGEILRSGFATDYGRSGLPITKVKQVDFLLGGVSSYKKVIFDEFRFSNRYRSASGYGQGEDKDFSYRVSRRYKLLINPSARLLHYSAPKKNFNRFIKGRAFILSRYYFFSENVKKSSLDWIFFWYAILGYCLYQTAKLISLRKRERDRWRGVLTGIWDILHNRDLDSL